jgi:hypothetical protein
VADLTALLAPAFHRVAVRLVNQGLRVKKEKKERGAKELKKRCTINL